MKKFDLLHLEDLPSPLQRYFKKVLKENQSIISEVHLKQHGLLRLGTSSTKWFTFDATYQSNSKHFTFYWQAKIRLASFLKLEVLDSYATGVGSGEVRLCSLKLAKESGGVEMNSGSLHRYLAELVWCPTALIPGNGLDWTPINEERALATLRNGDIQVELEFIFDYEGKITGIYSNGRWGKFKEGFKKKPWEGHFTDYVNVEGYLVPSYGEVGWYDEGVWNSVWEAKINEINFRDEKGETIVN